MEDFTRGRHLVNLVTRPREIGIEYAIVDVLELDSLHLLQKRELKMSSDRNLWKLTLQNQKTYHVLIVATGEKVEMEKLLKELIKHKTLKKQYKHLVTPTQSTQTQTEPHPEDQGTHVEPSGDYRVEEPTSKMDIDESNGKITPLLPLFLKAIGEHDDVVRMESPTEHKGAETPAVPMEILPGHSGAQDDVVSMDSLTEHRGPETQAVPMEILPGPSSAQDGVVRMDSLTEQRGPETQAVPMEILPGPSSAQGYKKKPHFCIYCKKLKTNIARHFTLKHSEEDAVKEFMSSQVTSAERKKLEARLRSKGDCEYNEIFKKEGKSAEPKRKGVSVEKALPCPNCSLLYSENTLNRHYKYCTNKPAPKNLLNIAKSLKNKENRQDLHLCSEFTETVLRGMPEDNVNNTIQTDKVILEYGNSLTLRHSTDIRNKTNFIRSQMRLICRLRLMATEIDNSILKVEDLFYPERWNTFIEAARLLGKMDGTVKDASPYSTIHAGYIACNIAKDFKSLLPLDEEGKARREKVQAWLDVYSRRFQATIGKHAQKVAQEKQWTSKEELPVTTEIQRLTEYLKQEIEKNTKTLKVQFSMEAFDRLNKATMLHLLTFNRRRMGEVSLLKIEDYNRKEKLDEKSDSFKNLNEEEKIVARKFFHVNVKGKWHRPVPLLLTDVHSDAIDLIIALRERAGVKPSNENLFGKGISGHYDGYEALSVAALECGAENPHLLTGTQLRKHAATVCQSLNLTENDLRLISGFLGHTVKTHLEHYRQPSAVLHTSKLSKVLVALDRGTIAKYKGKRLEEIQTDQTEEASFDDYIDVPTDLQGEHALPRRITSSKSPRKSHPSPLKKSISKLKSISPLKRSPKKSSPGLRQRVRWNEEEKKIMRKEFADHLKLGTLPSFSECFRVRSSYPQLLGRQVQKMKAWVNNQNVKRKKKRSPIDSDEELT